jgi:hypothetical protein
MVNEKKEDKNTQPTEAKVEEKAPKDVKKDKNDKKEEEEDLVILQKKICFTVHLQSNMYSLKKINN